MDACDLHIEQLIKSAINECRRIHESAESNEPTWLVESTNEAISAMSGYLESVYTSRLPRPSDGAGLGFSRGIGEWPMTTNPLWHLRMRLIVTIQKTVIVRVLFPNKALKPAP